MSKFSAEEAAPTYGKIIRAAKVFENAAKVFKATMERELQLAAHFERVKYDDKVLECINAYNGAKADAEAARRLAAEYYQFAERIRPSGGAAAWHFGMREFTAGFAKLPPLTGGNW